MEKKTLYKYTGDIIKDILMAGVNQEVIVNGKRLEKGCFLNNNDIIEYLDATGNLVKIIWKNPNL